MFDVHVRMCIRGCLHTWVCAYVGVCIRGYVHAWVCECALVHSHMPVFAVIHGHVCSYAHARACI